VKRRPKRPASNVVELADKRGEQGIITIQIGNTVSTVDLRHLMVRPRRRKK